jgi:hypothetical protein
MRHKSRTKQNESAEAHELGTSLNPKISNFLEDSIRDILPHLVLRCDSESSAHCGRFLRGRP